MFSHKNVVDYKGWARLVEAEDCWKDYCCTEEYKDIMYLLDRQYCNPDIIESQCYYLRKRK